MDTPNIIPTIFIAVILIIVIAYIVIQQNKKALQRKLEAERLDREHKE